MVWWYVSGTPSAHLLFPSEIYREYEGTVVADLTSATVAAAPSIADIPPDERWTGRLASDGSYDLWIFDAASAAAPGPGIVVPSEGTGRWHSAAVSAAATAVPEAPIDGAPYVRQDASWDALAPLLAPYAPLASPALSGVPTAPTASPGTSTTQIATTAFAAAASAAAAGALTTDDIANASGVAGATCSGALNALAAVDATKAPLASPALTGIPTAPTAAPGTSTTQLATTAFVAALGALRVAGYGASGAIPGLRVWVGSGTSNGSGVFTADVSAAGFTTVLAANAMAVLTAAAIQDRAWATLSSISTTSVSGYTSRGDGVLLGGITVRTAPNCPYRLVVFGT